MLLAGLVAGFWPDALYVSHGRRGAPLPTLQTVAIAQCLYLLVVWPIVQAFRSDGPHGPMRPVAAIRESVLLLVVGVPFYVVAGQFADASGNDLARTVMAVAGLLPLAWAAALWMATCRPGRPAVLLTMLALTLGAPATYYILREFLGATASGPARIFLQGSPITFTWEVARSQVPRWVPMPAWPVLAWLAIGAAAALINVAASVRTVPKDL